MLRDEFRTYAHALLDAALAPLPPGTAIRSVALPKQSSVGVRATVQLSEASFRRAFAGRTVEAYGHCNLAMCLGGIEYYAGTAEALGGAVLLDDEGRTAVVVATTPWEPT